MNKRELLDRCARDGEERVLLARVLDKLELSQNRGIPAHTPFLSPGEQASVQDLLNAAFSPTGRSRRTLWLTRRGRWRPGRLCFPGTPPCLTGTFWVG